MSKKKVIKQQFFQLNWDRIWDEFAKWYDDPKGKDTNWPGQMKVIERLVDEQLNSGNIAKR